MGNVDISYISGCQEYCKVLNMLITVRVNENHWDHYQYVLITYKRGKSLVNCDIRERVYKGFCRQILRLQIEGCVNCAASRGTQRVQQMLPRNL